MKHVICAIALLSASPVWADCPENPDFASELDALYGALLLAENDAEAQGFSNALWGYWTQAPDDTAQEMLDRGMSQRASYDLLGAQQTLTTLTEYCPGFAEGWNQRAFARYLSGQYEDAIPDLDRALEIRPRHLGALTGKALTLLALERKAEAVLVLRQALELNPWLSERHLLPTLEQGEQEL